MADLKHTTKRELRAALHAAQDEISRLVAELTTHQDAGKALDQWLAEANQAKADLQAQVDQLTADMNVAARAVGEVSTANKDLESIITSLQADLNHARGQLAEFEAQGVTLDVLASPVNLSGLRRVLDASDQDEPVFVLRAADMVAPQVVEWWASEAVKAGVTNHRKLGAALARAAEMRKWQEAHGKRIPN